MYGNNWRLLCFRITLLATLFFLVLTHLAMWLYEGGTIHDHNLTGYSFTYNFFSDLGRNNRPGGGDNFPSNLIFKTALTVTGGSIALFFVALLGIFRDEKARSLAALATLFGVAAGVCYIGIGLVPYDESYGGHRLFVRGGFISFLVMSLLFAFAIFLEKGYPKRYAWALLLFSAVLFSQILLMVLGDRSWRSNDALWRQATAQKVVVYAQIVCMIYQTLGVLRYIRK